MQENERPLGAQCPLVVNVAACVPSATVVKQLLEQAAEDATSAAQPPPLLLGYIDLLEQIIGEHEGDAPTGRL